MLVYTVCVLLEFLAESGLELVEVLIDLLLDIDWTSGGGGDDAKRREETFAAVERYKFLPKDSDV